MFRGRVAQAAERRRDGGGRAGHAELQRGPLRGRGGAAGGRGGEAVGPARGPRVLTRRGGRRARVARGRRGDAVARGIRGPRDVRVLAALRRRGLSRAGGPRDARRPWPRRAAGVPEVDAVRRRAEVRGAPRLRLDALRHRRRRVASRGAGRGRASSRRPRVHRGRRRRRERGFGRRVGPLRAGPNRGAAAAAPAHVAGAGGRAALRRVRGAWAGRGNVAVPFTRRGAERTRSRTTRRIFGDARRVPRRRWATRRARGCRATGAPRTFPKERARRRCTFAARIFRHRGGAATCDVDLPWRRETWKTL